MRQGLGQSEVEDFHFVCRGDDDVFGLEITVENATSMSSSERLSALPGERKKPRCIEWLLQAEPKSFSLDIFHNQVEFAFLFQNVVNGGHVLIGNAGGSLGFAEQAFAVHGIAADLGSNALESDGTL